LYLDENYFNSHTFFGPFSNAKEVILKHQSLVSLWGLEIPENMIERGIHIEYIIDSEDEKNNYVCDQCFL
jgi:hypothetical protein